MSEKKPAANEPETNVERRSSSSQQDFGALVARHRNYFRSGATRPVEWRGKPGSSVWVAAGGRWEGVFSAFCSRPPPPPLLADLDRCEVHTNESNRCALS